MARKIFVNYRRADSQKDTFLITARLKQRYGSRNVFIDENLIGGDVFPEVLERRLAQCSVMITIIGHAWTDAAGDDGLRRLAKHDDWVRHEIRRALAREIPLVPVLINGAAIPAKSELPADIARLADHHAVSVRTADHAFRGDIAMLIEAIDHVRGRAYGPIVATSATALLVVGSVYAYTYWPKSAGDNKQVGEATAVTRDAATNETERKRIEVAEAKRKADAAASAVAPSVIPKQAPSPVTATAPVPPVVKPATPPQATAATTALDPSRAQKPSRVTISEDIIGIRTGIPCRDALGLIEREFPDLSKPIKTGGTRYTLDVGGEPIEVLAETVSIRDRANTVALTCMPVGGQSVVVFVGRDLSFEKDGRNLADVEGMLSEKYGSMPHRMNVAAVNPFNMVRMGRVYGPDGVLPSGSSACGDFQATGGWTSLGRFGGANLNPLRLTTCIGGLFILASRNTPGRVTSTNIEVWDFRLAGLAAQEASRRKSDEINAKSKSRLPL